MSEETSLIERSTLAERVGGHVGDHDVLVELRFERNAGLVPIRGSDHTASALLFSLAANMAPLPATRSRR